MLILKDFSLQLGSTSQVFVQAHCTGTWETILIWYGGSLHPVQPVCHTKEAFKSATPRKLLPAARENKKIKQQLGDSNLQSGGLGFQPGMLRSIEYH
jgi:hypothetical protein